MKTTAGCVRAGVALSKLSVEDFLVWFERERDAGTIAASLAKYVRHLRGFLDYTWRSARAERNVLDGFRLTDAGRRREPRRLSEPESQRFMDACPRRTARQRRDRLSARLERALGTKMFPRTLRLPRRQQAVTRLAWGFAHTEFLDHHNRRM